MTKREIAVQAVRFLRAKGLSDAETEAALDKALRAAAVHREIADTALQYSFEAVWKAARRHDHQGGTP